MKDRILDYFLDHPNHLISLGAALAYAGVFFSLAGFFGKLLIAGTAPLTRIGGRAADAATLSEALPSVPTWWIPESFGGFAIAVLLFAAGLSIASFGREISRAMKH